MTRRELLQTLDAYEALAGAAVIGGDIALARKYAGDFARVRDELQTDAEWRAAHA